LSGQALGKIAEEIKKSVDFYESQKYSKPVSKVFFTGVFPGSSAMEEFMAKSFEMKLVFPNVASFMSASLGEEKKKVLTERAGVFISALGAALTREESLNLVPEEIRRKNTQRKNEKLLQIMFIAVASVLCLVLFFMWIRVAALGARIQSTNKEWDKIQSYRKLLDDVAFREDVRRNAMKNDLAHAALLKELANSTPSLVVLQQVRFSRADGSLVLVGEVHDVGKENVRLTAKFVNNLTGSVFFKNVTLANTTQETKDQRFRFEIRCVVKGVA
jgi:Tfp pilus assembly protein PilN